MRMLILLKKSDDLFFRETTMKVCAYVEPII